MKIVIEYSLFVNLFINSFIIKIVGHFFKVKPKYWLVAAFVGAIVAVAMPYFRLPLLAQIAVEGLLAFGIMSMCFNLKPIKDFILMAITLFCITFLFGGACYAVQSKFGPLPLLAVCLICTAVYIFTRVIIWHHLRVKRLSAFVFEVEIDANGQRVCEQGYLDSGNVLYDPIVKKPIVLITYDVFAKIYKDVSLVSIMLKNVPLSKLEKGHYVKINSVSSGTAILVFSAQKLIVSAEGKRKEYDDVCLGLSMSGFEKSLGKNVLLHSEFAC